MGQGSLPPADGLNAEELAGIGVKVGSMKQLLAQSAGEKQDDQADRNPPKLISLDQVTVRGEDLTGKTLYFVTS